MTKNFFKKNAFYLLAALLIIGVIYYIAIYYHFFQDNPTIVNNNIYSNMLPKDNFKSSYTSKVNFEDMPISIINDVTLNISDTYSIKNLPILLKSQRYYIPLELICNKLNYKLDTSNGSLIITNDNDKITLSQDSFIKNSTTGSLRGNIITKDTKSYISISDIEEIFNLIAVFNFTDKSISLLPNNIEAPDAQSVKFSKKVAFLRLEDFTAGYSNLVDKNQTKIKCMANFLYSNNIKFHIAWIPRFKLPSENIDNDLLTNDSMANIGFINMLDYLINKGGEVGLHGYTHQHDDENTAAGEELSKDVNNTEEETRAVIEKGIDTATALNIPIKFYESPHYRDTKLQQSIIEQYYQILYEPYDSVKKNIFKTKSNNLYVPTPLSYVKGDDNDMTDIINGYNTYDPEILKSCFYHPSKEIDFIDFNIKNNKLEVSYDTNSPLQKIVKLIKDNKYTTLHVSQLIDK